MEDEIITEKTIENSKYKMRQFSYLCSTDILLCCRKCFRILCSNGLIEKILRINTGYLYFIIEERNDENEELIKQFESNLDIDKKLLINVNNHDFKIGGFSQVFCKCSNNLGIKVKQTDSAQIFMLNKIILKLESLSFFTLGDYGIKPLIFYFKKSTLKEMDSKAFEIDEYIKKSGECIQEFFEMLKNQNKEIKNKEKREEEIDKLGNVLKYLIDKKYI